MPSHQPLRDRCNVPTRVFTERRRSDVKDDPSSHTRRRLSACVIEEVPRTPRDPHGPRQFIPYLYLFSPPVPGAPPPPGNWTHTLRLLPPSKTRPTGSTDLVNSGGAGGPRGLNLHIPTAAFKTAGSRKLHLSTHHLVLARDFLALALPYYASAHPPAYATSSVGRWPESSPDSALWSATYTPISHAALEGMTGMIPPVPPLTQADPVRVLVLGPPRLVLAIGLVYLAYASGCGVRQVMRGVLEGDGDGEWCGLIGLDGQMGLGHEDMKMLEQVAVNDL